MFMDAMFGPHTIDRFANHENRKTERFNSAVWNPGCEQVDAFSMNWKGENNWLVPPIYLVPEVLRHIVFCKASGTLIVPHWKSAPYWPLLFAKKVQVGKDQEKAQSEKDSHSKNRGGKKPN